ncbi:MAG TPA: AgmX/PglI C-terminal domain-containing protein [Polyangiaceae bacterium]|nr:AgmX/PglI C-terminal domain-containing protein [Polyangiaceae bacterium]
MTGPDPAEAAGPKPGIAGEEGPGVSKAKALSNERVLASARGRIRACTEDGVYRKPSMAGRVQFALTVGGNGSVSQATLTRSGTVDDGVVACIRRVLQGLHFDPPESGTSTVNGSFKVVNASQQ